MELVIPSLGHRSLKDRVSWDGGSISERPEGGWDTPVASCAT